MFSEYPEDIKPSDDILKEGQEEGQKDKENDESNVDDSDKKEKNGNTEGREKKEQERQAEEAKAKINEWYNVLSNGYPQGFQKTLSNVEKDGKEISNILNINFREKNGERQLSLSISEREKEKGKESNTTRNIITWDFSNFQENLFNNNKDNSQDFRQNIFPSIAITKTDNFEDIGRVLSQIFGGNENQGEYLSILTQVSEQQNISKIVGLIDKNIMRSPINDFYGYHDHLNKTLEDVAKENNIEIPEINSIKENEIHDYILNTINKDTLSVYKKNVFDIMLCLCIVLRNSSSQEITDLKNTDKENEKSLLTSISTLTNENMVEYLSSNLDFLLDNNLKSWTLQKYGEDMEMEEFIFLTP